MKAVALVEYDMPRVLTVDFSQQSVNRMKEAGFNVKNAVTGVLQHHKGEYCIPCSINEVEIVFFHVRPGAFDFKSRQKSPESIEEFPCFDTLLQEVWKKGGVAVFYIDGDFKPSELEQLGIINLGVLNLERKYIPSSFVEVARKEGYNVLPSFPEYKGIRVLVDEESTIGGIYYNYLKHAKQRVLSVKKDICVFGEKFMDSCQKWVVTDDSSVIRGALCIEIKNYRYDGISKGRIIVLPSFGEKTVDVSLELLKEDVSQSEPYLFSDPNHEWLNEYLPASVLIIKNEKEGFIADVIKKIQDYDEQIKEQHELYCWLDALLVKKDDEFASAVHAAFEFMGFDVVDVDKTIPPGERKREDYRIHDGDFFALMEVKSTDRGANEKMIQDLQTHIARYMREFKTTDVPGFLIVNHSIRLDPKHRHEFYRGQDLHERLSDNYITAIDSIFLHELCQKIISKQVSKEDAKRVLKTSGPVLTTPRV